MSISFSLKVIISTSICISTVAVDASNCPLATIIWNSGGGFHLVLCGANIRFLYKSTSRVALNKAPLSMRSSGKNSPNSLGKYSILRYFSMLGLLIVSDTLWFRVALPEAVRKFGRQRLHFASGCFVLLEEN